MFFRKRASNLQRVMCNEPFIAAYSNSPFYEARDGAAFPDYVFDDYGGLHFCLRVGELEMLWGFGDKELGFGANGSLIVKRRNVDASSLDMKGIPVTRVGEICYIFVNRVTERGREGFARYLEPRLLPHIKDIARRYGKEGFSEALPSELIKNEELRALLDEHGMDIVSASVASVVIYDK